MTGPSTPAGPTAASRVRAAAGPAVIAAALLVVACGSGAPPTPAATTGAPSAAASATASPHLAYAALGASETYGSGASPVTLGYAYRLRDRLHLGDADFADVGIPGSTLADAYQMELTSALAIHPTLCTVFFGANDLRARVPVTQFASDLTDLVTTLRRAGANVLVVGLPDLARLPALRVLGIADLAGISTAWNAAMAGVATSTGSAFLDLTPYTDEIASHPEDIAADGLHPSNQGHARLADLILAALQSRGYIAA